MCGVIPKKGKLDEDFFHCPVTLFPPFVTFLLIGPLVQRACVYLHTDDSSSFASSNFPVITAWSLSLKGQYLSLPHTSTCVCTHITLFFIHTNENQNRNGVVGTVGEMKMLIQRRYKALYAYSPLSCRFIPA